MRKQIYFAALCLLLLAGSINAQPAVSPYHPWRGAHVAYFGDSVTDPRNSGSKIKDWPLLQQWLGITTYPLADGSTR